jgi:hypothetical protein
MEERMRAIKPAYLVLALLFSSQLFFVPSNAATAQTTERCFTETGFCIVGRFRAYWEQNGGLAVFGYPITEARRELNRETGGLFLTQWFERTRFEAHPENQPPYDVLLGRIGDDRLQQQGRSWQAFSRDTPQAGCRFFPETGQNVCGAILAWWRTHGLNFAGRSGTTEAESIALFGLPLSPLLTETLTDTTTNQAQNYQVQWFERARFELHPENAPPFDVLLGRLGNEVRETATLTRDMPRLIYIDGELFAIRADGSGQTWLPITRDIGSGTVRITQAVWSANGAQLAVSARLGESDAPQLYVSRSDGTGAVQVAASGASPSWSPDNRRIVYTTSTSTYTGAAGDLYIVNADGSGRLQLTNTPVDERNPRWSPDGSRIAFIFGSLDEPKIGVVSLDQGTITQLTEHGRSPDWSPDGHQLAFDTPIGDDSQIAVINADGTNQHILTQSVLGAFGATWSPDGARIAFFSEPISYGVMLSIMNADGSQQHAVTWATPFEPARWSPDGHWLVFYRDDRVGVYLYTFMVDANTEARRIAQGSAPSWIPSVSSER